MPARVRRAAALTLLLCAVAIGAGVVLLRRAPAAPTDAAVGDAPLVRVRDAPEAAGGGEPVRLQGTLVAVPPIVTPAGATLALQVVEIGGDEGGAAAYRRAAPAQLFLTDGDSVVQVDAGDADPALLPLVAAGRVDDDGRLPPDVRVHLAPGLAGLPSEPGTRIVVYAIDATTPVLAHGRLELQEGVPTLLPPAGAATLVLTPMSPTEVDRRRTSDRRRRLALGWALVGVGALGAVGAAVAALRRR